jgi:chromosome segregation ATPase
VLSGTLNERIFMFGRKGMSMVVVCTLAAFVLAGGVGCSSMSRGEKAYYGFANTQSLLSSAQQQVDATLSALHGMGMTDPTNLNNAYSQYKEEVKRLEQQGKDARKLASSMKENHDQTLMDWQKEMDTMQDPTVKASAESRKEAIKNNYEQLRMYAEDARKAYDPFLQTNKDIVKALGVNLSPATLTSLQSSIADADAKGKTLKEKLAAFQHAMDNVAKGQPPIGK